MNFSFHNFRIDIFKRDKEKESVENNEPLLRNDEYGPEVGIKNFNVDVKRDKTN
jgi:hypothetical protein